MHWIVFSVKKLQVWYISQNMKIIVFIQFLFCVLTKPYEYNKTKYLMLGQVCVLS